MKRIVLAVIAVALIALPSLCWAGGGGKSGTLVAGGYEVMIGTWTPGEGTIEPGGRIRDWWGVYETTLIGPAGELASGIGPVSMSCNLDSGLTGPCWGTLEFNNDSGTWMGTWVGRFNFVTGAGSYHATAHGEGGLEGYVLQSDAVYPGYAVTGPGTGYLFSTVRGGPQ
jgi:hypothetical protein